MKIFVSYARVDKPYCVRVIETLRAHEVWYDQRLYAGQDWWQEILRRLDWCEVFIYLLSPDSIASRYCRRELEIARRLQRDIIPVLIDRDAIMPESLRHWQYVDLADSLTAENVAQLLNAILIIERERAAAAPTPVVKEAARNGKRSPGDGPVDLISEAVRALEEGEYKRAARLLRQARSSGYRSRFVRLDKLLRIAESAVADGKEAREAQREYQHIVALFAFESTRDMACEALAEFRKEFGDYDPQNLRRHCQPGAPAPAVNGERTAASAPARETPPPTRRERSPAVSQTVAKPTASSPSAPALLKLDEAPLTATAALPMLEWRETPHGTVTISSILGGDEDFGEVTEGVDNFVMSKYPVTNAQFAIFAQAEDGYRNPRWWEFSAHARRWFAQGKGVAKPRFSGGDRPRENVNWYEAMAFANWLSSALKMKITLPTIAQWQRAAKGDDDRYFPWGDEYDEERCNTLETGLKATTAVNRYHKGASPYGVYDMAGNVWEWTLNAAARGEAGKDKRRAVAGGSFVSPCDRAHTSFRYYLDPRVRYSSIGIRLVGLT